ncbi:AmpG family muropeptide MFS transporter [Candidatus Trichorickettsia mobilis]|uniref:AmpG family muropeptide MFS transporter n=1 Tax=Candidatus Trichorickettsia mobilis TaxID=1346319 RepID=UPI00292F0F03|nr:MFS transporter [Candidatus Trichorickettsia mobilis]
MLTKDKLFIIWLFGATSGFTLMISGNTLNYWLAKENIDIRAIGIFAFISIPYAINFIWAPIFDTKTLGFLSKLLGHRLSWICVLQFTLALFVLFLSKLSPQHNLLLFGILGLIISLLSSALDTVLGALRTEIIPKESQGAASGIYIFGYRIGMLLSSSGAIYLSAKIGWQHVYMIFAILIIFLSSLLIITLYNKNYQEPPTNFTASVKNKNIFSFINNILKPIGSWSYLSLIIIFLILYRLPDNFINTMINPFLIHLSYNEFEIASAGKFFGISAAIIGGLVASHIMNKHSIQNSLLIFGILHAIAHSLFIVQTILGNNLILLFIVIGFESITGGMTMAAYIAYIASLCHGKFRATQYSFFSSMMGLSRSIFPTVSGYIVIEFGWQNFFLFVTIMTIPSLLLSFKLTTMLKTS